MTDHDYWLCARCRKRIGERDPVECVTCVSLIYLGRVAGVGVEFEGEYEDSIICTGCVTLVERETLRAEEEARRT